MALHQKLDELSMFFPAYNEVKNIPILIKSALKSCKAAAKKYEIILVVHGNSSDGTIPLARKMAKKDNKIRVVIQPKTESGIGAAIRIGFHAARYKNIFYADSDNQFEIGDFQRFLPFVEHYDIIAGYRLNRKDPWTRIATSKIYNAIVRFLFLVAQRDVDCAFRFVKRKVIKGIKLRCGTGLATTELLAKARRRGYSIIQVGIAHHSRRFGQPVFEIGSGLSIPRPRVVLQLLKEMTRLFKDIYVKEDY